MPDTPDYEAVCKLTGQLFLESRFELERVTRDFSQTLSLMHERIVKAENERDEALSLIARKQDFLRACDEVADQERSHGPAQDMGGGGF